MKCHKIKIISFAIIISFVFSLIPTFSQRANAGAWGEPTAAAIMLDMMQKIERYIEGSMLGTLKITAAEMMNTIVGQMISSGGKEGALFTVDWRHDLITHPDELATFRYRNVLTDTFRGTGSSSNFIASGGNEGVIGSYAKQLENSVVNSTINAPTPKYTFDQYASSPSETFSKRNFRAWFALGDPENVNLQITALLNLKPLYPEMKSEERYIAQTQEIAYQGFKPQTSGDKVITPGSTIKDIQSSVQDLPNKIAAAANSPYEFLGGLLASTVNRLVTNTINNGIGDIQRSIQKEVNNVTNNYSKQMNTLNPKDVFNPKY